MTKAEIKEALLNGTQRVQDALLTVQNRVDYLQREVVSNLGLDEHVAALSSSVAGLLELADKIVPPGDEDESQNKAADSAVAAMPVTPEPNNVKAEEAPGAANEAAEAEQAAKPVEKPTRNK